MKQDAASHQELHAGLERFRQWYCEAALPFWATHGVEAASGGFYEALNFDSTPSIGRPRRVRTLARQVHTLTQAGIKGWHNGAEAIAARGFDEFVNHACPDGGARGCVFHIGDDGRILDNRRDLYDQAFLLLACASRIEAGDEPRALTLAENTIAFLNRELTSPHGGWLESNRKETPRRQNPHMHLFEAFMALYRVTGLERYLSYADKVYGLFCNAFYDGSLGVIREYFSDDWKVNSEDRIEPGHMLEWVWLLNAYEVCGRATPIQTREYIYERAVALGADPSFHGFIDNSVDMSNATHGAKRLWPQTEYLRASLVMAGNGSTTAAINAQKMVSALFDTYLSVEPCGLWIDEFDADGARLARDVPASILYHLFEAVAEADSFLKPGSSKTGQTH